MDLYPHQERLLHILQYRNQYAIFWAPRVMKTLPVALHCTNLLMQGKAESMLVVAPKSALGAWKRDFERFIGKRKEVVSKITLVNYELVWRRKEYDRPYDIVVLDESHRIAHRRTKQTRFCLKYTERSTYRYILTGTPLGQGRLQDLYTQMNFLIPNFWGTWNEFEARYCYVKQLPNSWVRLVLAYRNEDELLERVAPYVDSLALTDVANLPEEPEDNIVMCPRPNNNYQRGIKDMYVEQLDMIIPNPLVQLNKFRQIASDFIIDEEGVSHSIGNTKRLAFGELLDEIGDREKIVVFCEFKQSIADALREVRRRNLPVVVLDGDQPDKEIWRWYQEQGHMRIIICQYGTANAGIDLWTSQNMIFYEPSLSTQMMEQARNRIKSAVDLRPRFYHWLISEQSIEEHILKTLNKHQNYTVDIMQTWNRYTPRTKTAKQGRKKW